MVKALQGTWKTAQGFKPTIWSMILGLLWNGNDGSIVSFHCLQFTQEQGEHDCPQSKRQANTCGPMCERTNVSVKVLHEQLTHWS